MTLHRDNLSFEDELHLKLGSKNMKKTIMKTMLKKVISPKYRHKIKIFFSKKIFDEVEIVYDAIKNATDIKVMIDVGAGTGVSLEAFARDGWYVYAFEPDPNNRNDLRIVCRNFPNVRIDPRAVSNKNEKQCKFFTSDISQGISSLSSFDPSHKESWKVDTVTLETFCLEAGISDVSFLKIDAEGFDFFVLQKVPWDNIKPKVILCEFENKKTIPLGYTFYNMADFLEEKGYKLLISEWYPILRYGARHRWRRLVHYPCELIDENAFGNILAVNNEEFFKHLCSRAEVYEAKFR